MTKPKATIFGSILTPLFLSLLSSSSYRPPFFPTAVRAYTARPSRGVRSPSSSSQRRSTTTPPTIATVSIDSDSNLAIDSSAPIDRRGALGIGGLGALSSSLLFASAAVVVVAHPPPAYAAADPPPEFRSVGVQAPAPEGESPFRSLPDGVKVKDFKFGKQSDSWRCS